jgi:hypothetical protein
MYLYSLKIKWDSKKIVGSSVVFPGMQDCWATAATVTLETKEERNAILSVLRVTQQQLTMI